MKVLQRACHLGALLLCAALFTPAVAVSDTVTTASVTEEWLAATSLPPVPDSLGVAGAFAGVSRGTLIAGGGANFPNGMPWENGTKIWHETVWALPFGTDVWTPAPAMAGPRGYGVSVSVPAPDNRVINVGGSDADRHYADAFAWLWADGAVKTSALPPLPHPVANMGGALAGDTLYIVGGTETPQSTEALATLYALNITEAGLKEGWKRLDDLPGKGRILPAVTVLRNELFVMSGAALAPGADGKPTREYLRDTWSYKPGRGWKQLADMPRPAVAAPVLAPKPQVSLSFYVMGGDDGSLVDFQPVENHPGFPANVLAYDAITDTWTDRGAAPISVVTAPIVPLADDRAVVVSGEIRPGVRTPAVSIVQSLPHQASFGTLNYMMLVLYLLMVLGIGFYCSLGNKTTDDYFRGGQSIPWWGAGVSIFATTLSSITFMAMPAKAYETDWVFMLANLSILLIAPFIIAVIMPIFRRLNVTSVYEYLELRFNLATRLFGSAAFVLFQLGRMAIVMFLPALALATVTNFDVMWCIGLMGVLTVIYCIFGGIKADIWTDFVQAFVFMGGAAITLIYILSKTDGGLTAAVAQAAQDDKLKLIDWSWDYTVASIWVVLLGNIFANLITYASDQCAVQRYMSTESEETARRSIWLNAFVAIPSTVIFFVVGTALYVYYTQHPARLVPGLKTDAIFPLFIARELPAGIAGILLASVFAVAQSTISTSMNSMSSVIVTDWYQRLSPTPPSGRSSLILARVLVGILGISGTACAMLLAVSDVKSIWDFFLEILGLTGGALTGLFLLGILTRRANGIGATIGMIVSVMVLFSVQRLTNVHFFLYAMVGILTCFIVGYLCSFLAPAYSSDRLKGLTWLSIKKNEGTGT